MPKLQHHAQLMIVDDDVDASAVLADLLDVEGYDVTCCSNGKDALDHLRTCPLPGLIILDLQMPVMNGWQFRREQRADRLLSDIPVVVVSGFSDSAEIQANAVMRKPVDVDRLLAVIRRLIGN
jgi:CheY-like chemotaxis protein